ncbi:TubC N-terminal docking domain-related protein [Roseimaritima sediminicola]|uniref:TubC N-terminal docking domain-related protein n=1 Tax=Roseimaritima sediminicola TaxID=2662066 RepID=UPI00129829B8|nr:hypothetical protein [Roseimaritima sediminicola]
MTPLMLVDDLMGRGVYLTVAGDALELDAPPNVVTDADVEALRANKQAVVAILRLDAGLSITDADAELLACEEIAPADVPMCDRCGRLCDVQTLAETWHCSHCDPAAAARRERTVRLMERAKSIRCYNQPCNG